jgi:hypothetical protein
VGEERWFCRGADEWSALAERVKQISCPHCKTIGALVRHGFLRGFDETSPRQKTVRARRIFCSNRQARPGCGRTFSVWLADKIRRLSLSAGALWRFLQAAVIGGIPAASRAIGGPSSDRTMHRIWVRFDLAQSKIRTALCGRGPPPECSLTSRPLSPMFTARSPPSNKLCGPSSCRKKARAFQQTTPPSFVWNRARLPTQSGAPSPCWPL